MGCKVVTSLLPFLSLLYALVATGLSCPDTEREALLMFIGGLDRTVNNFSSWAGKDCCRWNGVGCDNITGHVTSLDLRGRLTFSGDLDMPGSSLIGLKHLNYLDLSSNEFLNSTIPEFICSFKELNHLNLSLSSLYGPVPVQFGNLSRLHTLDLSYNSDLRLEDASWISKLTSLHYLDLSYGSIGEESNWLQELNMLPSVAEFRLAGCVFGNFPLSLPHVNFTSLSFLDLSSTSINTTFPSWLFQLSNLQYLYLSNAMFHGLIPNSLSNLCKLHALDLSSNLMARSYLDEHGESFSGCIRNSLQDLYLSNNLLSGKIPDWIGSLKNLKTLDLSGNSLFGSVPDWIGSLKNLKTLDLSENSLFGSVPDSLGRLSSLQILDISYNNLNGTVSKSLGQLSELVTLSLSHNSLVGVLTEHHFANLTRLKSVDLSSNSLVLNMRSNWVPPFQLNYMDLTSCQVGPRFPSWLLTQEYLTSLDLSSKGISGSIPNLFWSSKNSSLGSSPRNIPRTTNLVVLDVPNNNLSGGIPDWLCNLPQLESLNLSNNKLSGELPNCTEENTKNLAALDLSNNNLSGGIPEWLCNLPQLQSLNLSNNKLSGELPLSLKIYTSNTSLNSLDLSDNMLTGRIPPWLGGLPSLRTLILASNNFAGEIPSEFSYLNLEILDLSSNKLSGAIPNGVLALFSIDFSSNSLSGEIPSSLCSLYDLKFLNLSYNDLSGAIPTSCAFANPNSYVGNIHLCGVPLNVSCEDEEESWEEKLLFWLITGVGFGVGFFFFFFLK